MNNKAMIDAGVIVLYLIAVSVVGFMASKKDRDSKEGYFVGGRRLSWMVVGMSLFATGISSMQFVGQAGLAYKIGIGAANPQLLGAFMLGFSAIFFVPMFIRSNVFTVPDILERRYSSGTRTVYGVTILTLGVFSSPFGFYAGGLAVLEIFQLDEKYLWVCCLAVGILIGVYAVGGGFTAVIITDFMQGALLLVGGIIVVIAGLMALPDWSVLTEGARERHLDLILPHRDPYMPWSAAFTGSLVASLIFATVNHAMLQKMLGAKDVYNARCGVLMAAGLKVFAVFVIVLPGVLAASLFPEINPDAAFPTIVNRLLPVGLSGLVLAAMIAALMSSADSGVNALAGIVSLNLYPLARPNATDKESVMVGKTTALLLLAWSVAAAPFVGNFGLIFPLVLKFSAYLLSPIGVCYLAGRFSRRINRQGALFVMGLGYAIGIYFLVGTTFDSFKFMVPDFLLEMNFYHISPMLFLFYLGVIFVVSWLTPPPDSEKVEAFMLISNGKEKDPHPWYQSFNFWLIGLFGSILATYLIF